MSESVVLSDVDERGVATVTLNRPEVNNAYNDAVIEGIARAFAAFSANPAVRLVVLRGNGKHFQAGADLSFLRVLAGKTLEEGLAFSRLTVATPG